MANMDELIQIIARFHAEEPTTRERSQPASSLPPQALARARADLLSLLASAGDHPTPALFDAQQVGERAAARGFDWKDPSGPRAKITEELEELDEAMRGAQLEHIHEELGDLLFSIVNLARHLDIDAEGCLRAATAKFQARFDRLQRHLKQAGSEVEMLDAAALESTWQHLKVTGS